MQAPYVLQPVTPLQTELELIVEHPEPVDRLQIFRQVPPKHP